MGFLFECEISLTENWYTEDVWLKSSEDAGYKSKAETYKSIVGFSEPFQKRSYS